jgi:hypothetical protein
VITGYIILGGRMKRGGELLRSFTSIGCVRLITDLHIIEKGVFVMKSCPPRFEPRAQAFSRLKVDPVNACWLTHRPVSLWTAERRPPQRK